MKWEYRIECRNFAGLTPHKEWLDGLGREGWDLVCTDGQWPGALYFFKRQVHTTQVSQLTKDLAS